MNTAPLSKAIQFGQILSSALWNVNRKREKQVFFSASGKTDENSRSVLWIVTKDEQLFMPVNEKMIDLNFPNH